VTSLAEEDIPATPTTESATANTATQINISWSGVTGATSYQLFSNQDGSTTFGPAIATIPDTGSPTYSFPDNSVAPGTQYFYEVLAVNDSGSSPAPAMLASATTPQLPDAPSGLAVTNVVSNEIDLSWNATSGADSYLLQSSPSGLDGTWSTGITVLPSGGPTESYADTSVSPVTDDFYQLTVTTADGTSLESASVNAITAPAMPTGLTVTKTTSSEIDLSWTPIAGAMNYQVQSSLTGLVNSW
jgi:fibronectin type 3 domain-containing protein